LFHAPLTVSRIPEEYPKRVNPEAMVKIEGYISIKPNLEARRWKTKWLIQITPS